MQSAELDALGELIADRVAEILARREAIARGCTTCRARPPAEGRKSCQRCLDKRQAAYKANPGPANARARERSRRDAIAALLRVERP